MKTIQFKLSNDQGYNKPKLWTIEELLKANELVFDELVLEENGYAVYFSNKGSECKKDPLFNKRRIRVKSKRMKCTVKGCNNITRSSFGVCKYHKETILEFHPVDWVGYFLVPQIIQNNLGEKLKLEIMKENRHFVPMHGWIIERLLYWANHDVEKLKLLDEFMKEIENQIPGRIPDATTLQESLMPNTHLPNYPKKIVNLTKKIVEKYFPKREFVNEAVPDCKYSSKPRIKNEKSIELTLTNFPLRIVATLVVLAMIAEEANRGDAWFREKYGLGEPERAGAHFAYTIYVLRKENRMTIKQITKLLQVPPWE
ncbi:MAG: hypothetical protein ACTSYR_01940 [Candidatus Odinarchaeia archaeon]